MKELEILRKRIDNLDNSIARLLLSRLEIAKKIGKLKKKSNSKIFDLKRETKVINNVKKSSRNNKFVVEIYKEIIEQSKKVQK